MKFKVKDGWQVNVDGKVLVAGKSFESSSTPLVLEWLSNGWIEQTKDAPKSAPKKDAPKKSAPKKSSSKK